MEGKKLGTIIFFLPLIIGLPICMYGVIGIKNSFVGMQLDNLMTYFYYMFFGGLLVISQGIIVSSITIRNVVRNWLGFPAEAKKKVTA